MESSLLSHRPLIDTRLCPFDSPPRVLLYPDRDFVTIERSCPSSELEFRTEIANQFSVPAEQVHFARSGSSALKGFLAMLCGNFSEYRVALPSFCCHEVYTTLTSAEVAPVLYDLNGLGELETKTLFQLKELGVSLVIWPQYFAEKERSSEIFLVAQQLEMQLLLDEAQTFPFAKPHRPPKAPCVASLVSFGRSKKLNGESGGAIVVHDSSMNQEFERFPFDSAAVSSGGCRGARRSFDKLDLLLENIEVPYVSYEPLDPKQLARAYYFFNEYQKAQAELEQRAALLRHFATEGLGVESLALLGGEDSLPSVFALKVSPSERFPIMARLKARGVQSTWFYFPLHLQSRSAGAVKLPAEGSLELSASVLIVPFRQGHRLDELSYVGEALCQS